MEIRNLPTDWSKPHIVIGYGVEVDYVIEMLKTIKKMYESNGTFAVIGDPERIGEHATIEFFPLTYAANTLDFDEETRLHVFADGALRGFGDGAKSTPFPYSPYETGTWEANLWIEGYRYGRYTLI